MATTYFADRGYAIANGVEIAHLKNIRWTVDESLSRVETMTRNRRTAGYKKGNRKVSGSFELEVPDDKPQIDLSFNYGKDFSVIATLGNGERHQLIGLEQASQDLNGGVGESGKSIAFEAIDAINEGGPAVNASIGL